MSGKRSRDKGCRFERALTTTLISHGIPAKRVPLSGAMAGFKGDVLAEIAGIERAFECKARKDGFREIYGWLDENDHVWALAIKADRRPTLIVQLAADWLQLAAPQEPTK